MLFAVLFSTLLKVALQLLKVGGAAIYMGLGLLVLQLAFMFDLYRQTSTIEFLHSSSSMGDGWPKRRWFHSAIPAQRLEKRLRYIVQKFSTRTPWWQFVLWLRQIALLLVEGLIPLIGDNESLQASTTTLPLPLPPCPCALC